MKRFDDTKFPLFSMVALITAILAVLIIGDIVL